ncbi:MAG: hypothetical protein M3M87_06665 [Thermoproteota archaeon]|nr:hypothetical protein [Thermoproteota archaeon]
MQPTPKGHNAYAKVLTHFLILYGGALLLVGFVRLSFRIDSLNGTDTYVIQFDLGRKFSLYVKTLMKSVFEHFNVQNAEAEMTDNTVILKINV